MRLRGTTRLRNLGQQAINTLRPGALVLSYHRVAETDLDPCHLSVSPRHFEEHLEVVKRLGRPTRLSRLTERPSNGPSLKGAVAITFDDGYEDNYRTALPLLEKHDIPATIFVVSGAIGAERGFWWDELASVLLGPGQPSKVSGASGHAQEREPEGAAARQIANYDDFRDLAAQASKAGPDTRLDLYHRVRALMRPLSAPDQRVILDRMRDWVVGGRKTWPAPETLSARQIGEMADGGLIEFGGHTASHPDLTCHGEAYQKMEIETGKRALEELTGYELASFAYPYGEFGRETPRLVRAAGYKRACTTSQGHIRHTSDPFLLPRYGIMDCNGEDLSRWLFTWARE